MKKIKMLLVLVSLLYRHTGFAQQNERTAAINELRLVARSYLPPVNLSFDVNYYYAAETSPLNLLDSMKGSCQINGSKYWYQLDNVEMLSLDTLAVILYKEDKLMYLAKPSAAMNASNPLSMLDSFLVKGKDLTFHLVEMGKQKVISIEFDSNAVSKKVEYYLDASTGLITKMINVVKAEELYDPSVRGHVASGTYAIVETRFSHYQRGNMDTSLFNTSRYFSKAGNTYTVSSLFSTYTIFLSNPGL